MKKILKQVAGIDVAKDELVVTLGRIYDDMSSEFFAHKVFENTNKGCKEFLNWTGKLCDPAVVLRFVMEATGVYHESLAYFLDDHGCQVSIVLPNKISNYYRTLEIKTITDKTSSETIAHFALGRKLEVWQPPNPLYKQLRQLTRERGQLIEERTMIKNQMHAEKHEAEPSQDSIKRMKIRIKLLVQQEKEIVLQITALIKMSQELRELIALLCSITGIGLITAATVMGETNGFDLIRNKRQLTSYCGLDVIEKQSGTSVKGKPKISKRGNKYLRKAMHFPALTAVRRDQRYKDLYARLIAKHGIKMKAVVAVQRKLLEMCFTVYKTKEKYQKDYLQKREIEIVVPV
jgi:transposase